MSIVYLGTACIFEHIHILGESLENNVWLKVLFS